MELLQYILDGCPITFKVLPICLRPIVVFHLLSLLLGSLFIYSP
jgi:hypothetical protein